MGELGSENGFGDDCIRACSRGFWKFCGVEAINVGIWEIEE